MSFAFMPIWGIGTFRADLTLLARRQTPLRLGVRAGPGFSREKAQESQKSRTRLRGDSSSKTGTNLARPFNLHSTGPECGALLL